jgi:hypothetical protein
VFLMNRLLGIASALVLFLLTLVPAVAAAEPWDQDEHVVLSTGGDLTFAENQHADLLVVIAGDAVIEGDAKAVFVIDGTVTFVGARTNGIVAINSTVNLDQASHVAGDVHTMDATINAPATAISGTIDDVGAEFAGAWALGDLANFVVYLAFVIAAVGAGLALAGLASRQVRQAEAFISHEPVQTIVASFAGLVGIVVLGALAIVTVVGVPLGLGILLLFLPAALITGYLVAGIWIGDQVLARLSPGVTRDRPYGAAVVGLVILGAISIVPVLGGLISLIGFGAVMLLMWRTLRRQEPASAVVRAAPVPSAS